MIRFLPDTWRDALLRPLAMAAPDAGVYVEIMAPDIRFAAIAGLLGVWLLFMRNGRWRVLPVVLLLVFSMLSFAVWMATTGNGRYFIPVLLAAGPLCVALIYHLPFTRNLRLSLAGLVLALQAFVVVQNNPWQWWGLGPWGDEAFFPIELDQEAITIPATYVTSTSISYSLVAPRFPNASRWVNISSQPDPYNNPDGRRVQDLLAASKSIQLLIPSMPDHMTIDGVPGERITRVINEMIGRQRLTLEDPKKCRLLRSRGIASQAFRDVDAVRPAVVAKMGFWVCPLRYPVAATATSSNEGSPEVNRALDAVEKTCPRFFPPGHAPSSRIEGGVVRGYSAADMKLYAFDDRKIYYRYWRALNPVLVGSIEQVLASGFRMNCDTIRGRSGLPWERQL